MNPPTEIHELFAKYAIGSISQEQLKTLEAALSDNAELRTAFIDYMNIDSALGDLAAFSDFELAGFDTPQAPPPVTFPIQSAKHSPRLAITLGAIAAALLLIATLWVTATTPNSDRPIATLVTRVDAVLTKNYAPWNNAALSTGSYQLNRGLVHLQFAGGVRVYIEAPARFDAISDKRLILHSGRLSANVPPEGVGFTVETPEAKVVDYGTEFAIEAENGNSEVHVFNGLVRVHPRPAKNNTAQAVDLRTSQAVQINDSSKQPVNIQLATNRFIRNFDEPVWKYPDTVVLLAPVAYYRMPIRTSGLICEPPQFSGELLAGEGSRPPHAPGLIGGSMRVNANSSGRGGLVITPPPLNTGQLTLTAFVFAESSAEGATVITNSPQNQGNVALSLNPSGLLQATVRTTDGSLRTCTSNSPLPMRTWRQIVVTADGNQLHLYEDGQLIASTPCPTVASSQAAPLWFGTTADQSGLWDGRIDEIALYNRALNADEVVELYQAVNAEPAKLN